MTTIHRFPLEEGSYATYVLLMSSILWAADLTNRHVDRATAYGMEVSTERSKIMSNSTNNISADMSMNGQQLEEMISFKYLGATLCKDDSCSAKVRIRIATAMAVSYTHLTLPTRIRV